MARPKLPADKVILTSTQRGRRQDELEERLRRERVLHDRIVTKLPPAPSHLDKHGKRKWREDGSVLLDLRMLTKFDLDMLEALAESYSMYRTLCERWNELGRPVSDDSGGKPHFLIGKIEKARAELLRLSSSFGFTPATRPKLASLPDEQGTEEDGIF